MGNILTQKRNGGGASATALDELTYNYHTTTDGLVSNRLYHVNDVVSAGSYTDDIDDQGTFNNTHTTIETANNYGYDELGNLVRDAQEEIASIEWTVYGKMKKITRNSGSSKADLEFGYDASGNRLWKKVTPKGSGAVTSTYYYLRDAQGNEMCRYVKYTNTTSQLMYVAQEHSIYGSSRVGVDNRKDTLYMGAVYTPTWGGANTSRRALGLKSFELANHLGNVLVTVSDKPVYMVSSGVVYFHPEITSLSDYYPFGAPINGRGYSTEAYRFGFNTQEKTDEISGTGNHFTAQFWEYDGRLGRRWNLDPVVKPWESLYACLSDNPVANTDPDGDDIIVPNVADRAPILKMINSKALGVYAFDKSGKLYQIKATGDASKFSKYYSDKLNAAIKDADVIYVKFGQTYVEEGVTKDVDIDAGGGVTKARVHLDTRKLAGPVQVTISGNENKTLQDTKGNELEDKPADILAHELVGHAIPWTIGSDTGNAVDNENKVRRQVKKAGQTTPSPERASERSHRE